MLTIDKFDFEQLQPGTELYNHLGNILNNVSETVTKDVEEKAPEATSAIDSKASALASLICMLVVYCGRTGILKGPEHLQYVINMACDLAMDNLHKYEQEQKAEAEAQGTMQ